MPKPAEEPVKILFVCIGNACRSQMAEAWARHLGNDEVEVASAGTFPLGEITPETFTVMSEKGISLDGQWSKGLREVAPAEMDVVVCMGRGVLCPLPEDFPGRLKDWKIPDPYGRGLEAFRKARDLIEQEVRALLNELKR
jgi:arsenate reductase